ncbi:MAG: DUF3833 family protein [Hyphomonas sp.]
MMDSIGRSQIELPLSAAMRLAWDSLGGKREWAGRVRGLAGLISRGVTIQSSGELREDQLIFREKLVFSDGVEQSREWSIEETRAGLNLIANDVELLREGRNEEGNLVFDYRLRLGPLMCDYRDQFTPLPNGRVSNVGKVYWRGIRIMTIKLEATPAS